MRIQLLVEADDVFSFEYETITRSEVYSWRWFENEYDGGEG